LLLIATLCVACDSITAFYIQNDTNDLHYVRVTVNRTGGVYVHQVDPRTAGYAVNSVDPGPPDEGDFFTVELLDATCTLIDAWGMPSTGGYLEISATPEFIRGFEAAYSAVDEASDGVEPSGSRVSDGVRHPTVMECGATTILP
jgi:hypothetical protein